MALVWGVVLVVLLLAAAVAVVWLGLRPFWRARGPRVVTCPETGAPAGVEVDAAAAAWAGLRGKTQLQLSECSRWPERAGCGQECLRQIESAPDGCLVHRILAAWFDGKSCALCGREFGRIDWSTHKPALLDGEGRTREWADVAAVELPAALRMHSPVCWDCHVIESLVRQNPERVVFRRSP